MGALQTNQKTARRKGLTAAAVASGSALLLATASPFVGVLGLIGAGYLTYDWFMFRAKRGMRF
jgi:threonine/homoserine/homoserine lactone efflux protein